MLEPTIIQKMKQTNISADPAKTKQRVNDLWKKASAEERSTVENLAGVKVSAVARAYRTGKISAKLAVAIAQALNSDPSYLTGESDDRGEYTEEILRAFLEKNKYGDLLKPKDQETVVIKPKATPKAKKPEKVKVRVSTEPAPVAVHEILTTEPVPVAVLEKLPTAPAPIAVFETLTDEDIIHLIRALIIKGKNDGKYTDALDKLKSLLLS